MAQRKSPGTAESGTFDAVPEADRAEQALPVDPDDAGYADIDPYAAPDDIGLPEQSAAPAAPQDDWSADPADRAEQSIAVPLGDDYDGAFTDEQP